MYTTFSQLNNNALLEPMFFGNPVNVSRYDQQKHKHFEKLIEKQLSFFWRPEEVDISKDRNDWLTKLTDSEKHIFISNLKYQTLLDSVQGRSPNVAFLPIVSLPELETWIETWAFSETIHSRSYTHILRGLYDNPKEVFDSIVINEHILKRATDVTKYYDRLIDLNNKRLSLPADKVTAAMLTEAKKALYLCIVSVNALEHIRFYVSFACTFAFVERELMEGGGKIMRFIARDEHLHGSGSQYMLNVFHEGADDPEMKDIAASCKEEARQIMLSAAEQEKEWAEYLFKDGSMIGLNKEILCQYVDYITDQRMKAIGFESGLDVKSNPIPWINHYLQSDNVQVAPQEAEIASYLVGQIDAQVDSDEFSDFDL